MSVYLFSFITLFGVCRTFNQHIVLQLAVDMPNFFDDTYTIFPRRAIKEYFFGYDRTNACFIRHSRNGQSWIVSLQNIGTLKCSGGSVQIEMGSIGVSAVPQACFEYRDHTYVFFLHSDGELSIFRSTQQKIVTNFSNHGRLAFDHIANRLYLIGNDKKHISELKLDDLEKWWITRNKIGQTKFKVGIKHAGTLPEFKSDIIIAGSHVYFIQQQRIYKYPLGCSVGSKKFVSNSSNDHFNFLLFKQFEKRCCDSGNIALSSLVIANSNSPAEGLNKIWLLVTYMVDVFLIAICVYVLKQLKKSRPLTNTNKSGSDGSLEADEYVIQAMSLLNNSKNRPRPHGESI